MKTAIVAGATAGVSAAVVFVAVIAGWTVVDWSSVGGYVSSVTWADVNAGLRTFDRVFIPLAVPFVLFNAGTQVVDAMTGYSGQSLRRAVSVGVLNVAAMVGLVWWVTAA